MFLSPPFEATLYPLTLRFKKQKLEDYYQESTYDNCLSYCSPFYSILLTNSIIAILTFYVSFVYFNRPNLKEQAWTSFVTGLIIIIGMILEVIVVKFTKLRILRSFFMGTCCFVGGAFGSTGMEKSPVFRPGAVALLLIAVIYCLYYCSNWIIGSLVACIGVIVWVVLLIVRHLDTASPLSMAVTVNNFFISIWIVPFILYWSEKRHRHNAFLQWSNAKVNY